MKKVNFNFVSYFFQLLAGVILIVAAFPKFVGAPESVNLFNQLDIENSRFLIASLEALAALLLIFNYLPHYGALLGFGIMIGAGLAHVSVLGFHVNGDGGLLVGLLVVVLLSTAVVMWIHRKKLPLIGYTIQ